MGPELDAGLIALAALGAGIMRGFTGFGGPAFLLAILTIFYTPLAILAKILIIDLTASAYLVYSSLDSMDWKPIAYLGVPTLIMVPLGQWVLLEADQNLMRYAIAVIISVCSLLMLCGLRYRNPLKPVLLIIVGAMSGVVFGATYIALLVVAVVLLGPYEKTAARALIIAWAFIAAVGYGVASLSNGTTTWEDVWIALPGAAAYFVGVWLGSRWFRDSAEAMFRNVALATLLGLSLIILLN